MIQQGYILDWSGFIFRAYHGLTELTDAQGRNINALYWFIRMIIRLMSERPDYFIICRDSPKPTLRKQDFQAYKAHRPSLDDNFKWQISQIKNCITKLQIPSRELAWYEADDLIASIVHHQSASDIHMTIVSGDKDLKQLISSRVTHYDHMKSLKTDPIRFFQEYGFQPQQLLDYLAILGDSSDNIPGVIGIWDKGAQSLIQQYGDLDTIYAHLDHISLGLKNKLIEGKESAYQSKNLVRLYHTPSQEIPNLTDCPMQPNYDQMLQVLVWEYQMNSLIKAIHDLKKTFSTPKQPSLFD